MKAIPLEHVYKPRSELVPLCILDFRVALHVILNTTNAYCDARLLDPCPDTKGMDEADAQKLWADWLSYIASDELWPDFARASWATRLMRGPDMVPRPVQGWRIVVVDDNKLNGKYWRTIVANDYKGTRSTVTDAAYSSLKDIGHQLCRELSLPFYTEPLYEADDWAGLVHRHKLAAPPDSCLAQRECYYSTVDSDWLQLVDDASLQLWANTGPWPSRLKNEAETRAYIFKRMGERIQHPRDIARVKQKLGDGADNLAIGSDLSLFDLCNANPDYDLARCDSAQSLLADLASPEANSRYDVLSKAARWLNSKALPITVSP